MEEGWVRKWQANGWIRNNKERALNVDLWEQVLELCEQHKVKFIWIRGHVGHPENDRCDLLSRLALVKRNLPPDTVYETEHPYKPHKQGIRIPTMVKVHS